MLSLLYGAANLALPSQNLALEDLNRENLTLQDLNMAQAWRPQGPGTMASALDRHGDQKHIVCWS